MLELAVNLTFIDLYSDILIAVLVVIFLAMAVFLILPMQRAMTNYYAVFYIVPFELLEKNLMVRHLLKKIPGCDKFYKL